MRSPKFSISCLVLTCALNAETALRPPAVPLIVHEPYFSIWSMDSNLTGSATKHWTGADQPLNGLIRIDGVSYRFMGAQPRKIPAMPQVALRVAPTQTIYQFEGAAVHLTVTFLTPTIASDMDLVSRPVTYLILEAHSTDSKTHSIALFVDASALIAVNTPDQKVTASHYKVGGFEAARLGTVEQSVLAKSGDDLRIDWGYFYLAAPAGEVRATSRSAREQFAASGALPDSDDLETPRSASDNSPCAAARFDFGQVSSETVSRHLLLAYDDGYSIEYFQRKLRPWWRRHGMNASSLLTIAESEFAPLRERSIAFDRQLVADLTAAGGEKYAALASLAYRQTLGAHKLVADLDGTPLYFSKENFSNGSIDTVDVTYPSAPFFLLLNPALLRAQLRPILDYASLPRWPWPYAPHDLGKYPLADGQLYGGGETSEENQMPVEESGNVLILLAAMSKADGGDTSFAKRYWPVLTRWKDYLEKFGLHPGEQLSTDDFAGHLANNTNLAIKAILGIAGYETLEGKSTTPAAQMAAQWARDADDGSHYRLAFDTPGSWSQKYNLVWDKILDYHLFPKQVYEKEIAFYKTKQNGFGLPLDNRETYTKIDWILWTSTLSGNQDDFLALSSPAYKFANETPTRVPLSDWYWTLDGKQRGFQARSVVGGIYIKMLEDPAIWNKWVHAATTRN